MRPLDQETDVHIVRSYAKAVVLNDPVNFIDVNGMDAFSDVGGFFDRFKQRTDDLKGKLCDSESEKIDALKDYFKENGKDFNETFSNLIKGF